MAEKIKFLKQIVSVLNSDYLKNKLNNCKSFYGQKNLVITVFQFLIATKRFDLLEKYIDEIQPFYPGEYYDIKNFLMKETNLPEEVINERIINNVINDGYLFHGTDISYNDDILKNGLQPPSHYYGEGNDFLKDIIIVNCTYRDIYNYNYVKGIATKLNATDPVNLNSFSEDKLEHIFLTPSINTSFQYSSKANTWFRGYVTNILENFNYNMNNIKWDNVDEIAKAIKIAINNSGVKVSEDQQQVFINFLYKYYPKNNIAKTNNAISIVFVPYTQTIIGNEFIHKLAENKKELQGLQFYNIESIFEIFFPCSETKTKEIIKPENIAILEMSHNKELVLRTNTSI